jgi:hypothetical protein
MSPCFYCLNPNTSICVCLACRSKYEAALRDLERIRKDADIRRAQHFKAQKRKRRR